MPPAGPFLSGQKGAKEPVKAGDSDFPRLNNPPLETAKKGELRFPLLGTSPRLFSWWSSGGGGLLRNAPAAPACLSLPYLPFSTLVGAAFMAARGRPQGSPLRRYALGRVPRLSPFRVGGRRPKAASLAPLGQFTFCPHRPALCRAGASSI